LPYNLYSEPRVTIDSVFLPDAVFSNWKWLSWFYQCCFHIRRSKINTNQICLNPNILCVIG
jgi:hypothetical protein